VLAALRLDSNDTHALYSVVTYFVSTGDLQKAQCVGDRLVQIDPMSNEALTRGYWNINAIDPEGALKTADAALASPDTALAGHDVRGNAYLIRGDLAAAEKEANEALRIAPRHYLGKSLKAMVAAARGDRTAALAAVQGFRTDAERNHWAALRVALVHAKLGNQEEALLWIRRCAVLGNHSWYALIKHPWLEPLQSSPDFQQVVGAIKQDLDDVRDDVVGVYQLMCR
jgi:tetratricopeptide (TPR) repeat protein